jgi:flagellar biosynthetic protein FlhB
MAESSGEKTEQPTPFKLKKARQEGDIPVSKEVPSAAALISLILALAFLGPGLLTWCSSQMTNSLSTVHHSEMNLDGVLAMLHERGLAVVMTLIPFVIVGVCVSAASSLITSGWAFAPTKMKFNLGAINPVKGVKNLFSSQSLVNLAMSVAKIIVVSLLTWDYLSRNIEAIVELTHVTAGGWIVEVARMILGFMVRVLIALGVIAAADMIYQKWQYKRKHRMTKQEVKEENRSHEGSPEVKGKRRGLQMEMARKRMLADVAEADVVVTNPTHYAVALKYDPQDMDAPTVVGKGADEVCYQIKQTARRFDVPIIERPALARSLYAVTEIGKPIPESMFVAVAEVLAMIYRLRKQRGDTSR